ncbi:MAG: DUF885 domain-containing protein [Pseudomonadota bacterium]
MSLRLILCFGLSSALALAACDRSPAPRSSDAPSTATAPAAPAANPSARLKEIADRHAAMILKANPEWATRLGVGEAIAGETYNARLGLYGLDASAEAREHSDRMISALRSLDGSKLTGVDAQTFAVLTHAYNLALERNQFEFGPGAVLGGANPYILTQISGAQLSLPQLLTVQQPLRSADDAENYLSRLAGVAGALGGVRDAIYSDADLGVILPAFAIDKALVGIEGFIAPPPAENPLVTELTKKLAANTDLPEEAVAGYGVRAREIVDRSVYPAYADLAGALKAVKERSPAGAGVWRLPEGEAFYAHALRRYGTGDLTADQVHEIGLAEVERITAEMDRILTALGYDEGSVGARFAALGEEPRMLYPNDDAGRERLLYDLRGHVTEVYARAPDYFADVSPQKVEVRRVPVYRQDSAPGGYYSRPPLDGSVPGVYWINLKDTADWPKLTLKTLTYHEAVPGHHFQITTAQALDLPLIRAMISNSEFTEGWALYAEALAAEMGLYEGDPESNLGRLQAELFRAARLVVDTGLHQKQWTREQAIDYMVATTGDTPAAVAREVERYSVWPGQACAYKLGMLKIMELRERAEAELGDGFDLKDFHTVVLAAGAVPLPLLEDRVDAWIADRRA